MTHRIPFERALPELGPDERHNVGHAYILDKGEVLLAMAFDPGDTAEPALVAHAIEMVTGLLYLRGWSTQEPEIRIIPAKPPRPGHGSTPAVEGIRRRGPARAPHPPRPDELATIVEVVTLAWCMEHRLIRTEQRVPSLMSAFAPHGVTLASVHIDLWSQALSDTFTRSKGQAGSPPDAARSPSSEYVARHLEGTRIRSWSLPGRQSVFVSTACEPAHSRAFLALEDTDPDPRPEPARELLHFMLARAQRLSDRSHRPR